MKFYSLKDREHVEVPDDNVQKQQMIRETKSGKKQTRYALMADFNGKKLYKFVNEETYNNTNVKEIDSMKN